MSVDPIGPIDQLEAELDDLRAMVVRLDTESWHAPTPCEGWTVADVVLHLAQTNEFAILSLADEMAPRHAVATSREDGTRGAAGDEVDAAAAAAVAAQRHASTDEIGARWERSATDMVAAFRARDPHDRVQWVAGTLSARTLVSTRIAETWIHAGDVARAIGLTQAPTARLYEIARLAWRTLPYAFARAAYEPGSDVRFDLIAPDGDRWWFGTTTDPPAPGAATNVAATLVRGPALHLCLVAARRMRAEDSDLRGVGPDADAVLAHVRTYA